MARHQRQIRSIQTSVRLRAYIQLIDRETHGDCEWSWTVNPDQTRWPDPNHNCFDLEFSGQRAGRESLWLQRCANRATKPFLTPSVGRCKCLACVPTAMWAGPSVARERKYRRSTAVTAEHNGRIRFTPACRRDPGSARNRAPPIPLKSLPHRISDFRACHQALGIAHLPLD